MPTTRKKEQVKALVNLFKESQVLIFTDYRGLSVSDIAALRRQLRERGVEYHVTKNTLTELAAHRVGIDDLNGLLAGPTAIAFVRDDIPAATKILTDFARTSRILQVRGALAGKQILNADQVADLAKLRSREEYIAQMLGSLQSPVANLARALNATLTNFARVLQARVDQLNEQQGGEATGTAVEAPAPTSA
jgi:large subunit ribosomal protein L10